VANGIRKTIVKQVNINRNPISGGAIVMVASLFLLWLVSPLIESVFNVKLDFLHPALNLLIVIVPVVFAFKFLDDTHGTGFKEVMVMGVIVVLNMIMINLVAPKFIPELVNKSVASFLASLI